MPTDAKQALVVVPALLFFAVAVLASWVADAAKRAINVMDNWAEEE